MLFYFAIFFFIAFLGGVYRYQLTENSRWLYYFLFFFLMFIAAFRAEGVDNDMGTYLTSIVEGWGIAEPSFFLISYLGYDLLGSTRLVFIIYALLAILFRFTAYRKLSPYLFLTLAVYFSTTFVTHEMNQIRAAVGFGLMLWAIYFWYGPKRHRWWAMGAMAMATFFHFSFIVPFLVIFFIGNKPNGLIWYLMLIPLAYFCHFAGLTPLTVLANIGGEYIATKIAFYDDFNKDIVQQVNVFSILVLLKLGIIAILYGFRELIAIKIPNFYLYLKMYIVGLFVLLFFSTIPGAAFRISDLFWAIEPLLLPGIVFAFKPRWLATILLLLLCTYWVWLNYVDSNFIRPYFFDFSL